ncbi:MarR family transcriptional regulator, partial [Streptomyces albidoflavus]
MSTTASGAPGPSGAPGDPSALFDTLQHQVAVFARRAEQTRLGGVGAVRNSM